MKKFESYFRVLPWFMALLLSMLAAGCGGSGQNPILGSGADTATLVPTVTAVTPADQAAGVPVNTGLITAAFSKAMDPATLIAANFSLACPAGTPVLGSVSYLAASRMATLTLTSCCQRFQCVRTDGALPWADCSHCVRCEAIVGVAPDFHPKRALGPNSPRQGA